MYIGVKAVVPQENYKLLLTFENDEQGIFDMKPYLDFGPVFKVLKDPRLFNTARVCFKTVTWANQADIDPEILYPDSVIL
ncbi:MAG: DUF2442 domain-containing protein [Dysgonamonadaceae bacterium]|jgi:hypothetical protein|nr:DUF2442 domain-containing protein [Dysgonamonadaceae bacterium]